MLMILAPYCYMLTFSQAAIVSIELIALSIKMCPGALI